jgi:hypothetical protein
MKAPYLSRRINVDRGIAVLVSPIVVVRAFHQPSISSFSGSNRSITRSKSTYAAGSRSNVSAVEETMPPMTTEASGFCTSEPIPLESIIGRNPKTSTSAVIITGRRRRRAALHSFPPQLVDVAHQDDAVHDRDARQGDEPDAGRDAERQPVAHQPEHAAHQRHRHAEEHDDGLRNVLEHRKNHHEDQKQRHRGQHDEALAGFDEVLERP